MMDLPAGWNWKTVGEVCEINPRHFDAVPADSDLISKVPMAAVETESGRIDATELVEYGSVKRKSLTKFQENDVLFAKVTPCMENGKIALAHGLHEGRAVGSTELFALRSRGAIEPEYLMYYLLQSSVRQRAEHAMTGAVGLRRVPRAFLASLRIPLPPLPEQRRIISAIEGFIRRIEIQRDSLRSILVRVSSMQDQITPTWVVGRRAGTYGSLTPADVDDGILPELLPGWKWRRLGEIAEVVGGVTKNSKKQGDPSFLEVPYLRVANVQRGLLDLDNVETIRVPEAKATQLFLQPGDVLLNEGGDRDKLGRGWIWEGQIENCIHQNHVFRARVRGNVVHPKIIAWHSNGFGKAWCERNGRQTTNLASISLKRMRQLPVPVPPADCDQAAVVGEVQARAEVLWRGITGIESALLQSEILKSRILRSAFSGNLAEQGQRELDSTIREGGNNE